MDKHARPSATLIRGCLIWFFNGVGTMAKIIIEPKRGKEGQIEYTVTYHDIKTDNQFMVTTTDDVTEALRRLRETLENEVIEMSAKK